MYLFLEENDFVYYFEGGSWKTVCEENYTSDTEKSAGLLCEKLGHWSVDSFTTDCSMADNNQFVSFECDIFVIIG